MSDLFFGYFGPLDKGSCVYFLILSMIFFFGLLIMLGGEIYHVVKNYKKLNFKLVSNGLIVLFNIFLAYFVNRLLYTMCNKSLA